MFRRTVSAITIVMLLISTLMLAFDIQQAGASGEAPPTEWTQSYGGTSADIAKALVQTADGGYALAGYTSSYGAGELDAWLVKTDASGNKQWSRTYGGTGTDIANALVQTADGGYALAGYTYSYGAGGPDFWLVKADSSGNLQWSKTYGGTKTDIANTLIQTTDGGYALGGMTVSYCVGEADFWLVKTDANGNAQWTHAYGGAVHEEGKSLVQAVDGGYALAGWTNSYGAGADDMWLVKTDSAGNLQWSKTYGGTWYDEAYALVRTTDGGYALAGNKIATINSAANSYLVKTDGNGNIQWEKTYGGSIDNDASALVQTTDGGYALAGRTYPPANIYCDFWLVKADSSGNQQWDKTCGGADHDIANALVQTVEGGYALAGYTYSYGAGGPDFWLVKVGSGLPPQTYILTITASVGGTTSPAPGSYGYGAGAVISASAWQYSGYQLDHWELDSISVGSANPYSVTMNSAHTLRAVFAASSQRPVACFFYSPRTLSPVIGEDVWFDASQSKGATLYTWDFSDPWGPTSTIFPKIPHAFHAAGTYNVKLTVTNFNGQTDTTSKTVNVKKPPVILVHGFQSNDNYNADEIWMVMKNSLSNSGFTAYVSHYAWGSVTSEPIRRYAESLKWEIEQIRQNEKVDKVDIVAHSMGGLVARCYIESGGGEGCVRKLIMLETPNQGCLLPGFTGLLKMALATCVIADVDPQAKAWADRISSSVDSIPSWILSEKAKAELKLLQYSAYVCSILARATEIINNWASYIDILAGRPYVNPRVIQNIHYANIVGYLDIIPEAHNSFVMSGVETKHFGGWANWHAKLPDSQEVIQYVKYLLDDDPGNPSSEDPDTQDSEIQSAPTVTDRVFQSEEKWHAIDISNSSVVHFVLQWSEDMLDLELVSPNGTLIDPAVADPTIAYYCDANSTIKGYAIRNPDSGVWSVSVSAVNVSDEGEEYSVFVYLDTNATLFLELPKNVFGPNEPIGICANLTYCNQPIAGALVGATIQKPDGLTESIGLYDDGLHGDSQINDGLYGNVFTNSSLWGTYQITAAANGSINDDQLVLQASATAWVEQYPDLSVAESDITFSNEAPTEGQTIYINATIHNIGEATAHNASILFYDGNQANGTLIGECEINVILGEAETASMQWNTTRGEHEINALISPYNEFLEMNYTNNVAIKTIEVTGHDLTALAIITAKTVVGQAYGIKIDAVVENQGDFPEDFSVTLYANATVIGVETVASVPNGTWTILTFTWNTTGYAKGNYIISAAVDIAPEETNTADNMFVYGKIAVTIPGDVDGSFTVTILDVVKITGIYASKLGDPNFGSNSDINDDGSITILDVVICTGHYGQKWP